MQDTVVRMRNASGAWEVTGRDRFPGVVPESVRYDFNDWGPDTASYVLRRQPGDADVDLDAFNDVEIEIGGTKVWDGRVRDNPSTGGSEFQIGVQCEGMQYHLDDDVYERAYAHTNMTEWRDHRSFLDALLTTYTTAPTVVSESGGIVLGWAANDIVAASQAVGVTLDLGPSEASWAKRVVVEWQHNAANAGFSFYPARGLHTINAVSFEDAISPIALTGTTTGTSAGTFTAARRYVHMFLWTGTVSGALGAEVWVRIKAVRVFSDTAYESGNASVLRSHHVVRDALSKGTAFISNSGVVDTSFNVPEYASAGAHTPREHIQAINAYENRRTLVTLDRSFKYDAKPTRPTLVTAPGAVFNDVGSSSSEAIHNKVIVEGEGPDGQPLRVIRYAARLPGATQLVPTEIAFTNPSADVNVTSWTQSTGSPARDTSVFDSSPASIQMTSAGEFLFGTLTGTLLANAVYTITGKLRDTASSEGAIRVFTGGTTLGTVVMSFNTGTWTSFTLVVTTTVPVVNPSIQFSTSGGSFNVDTLSITRAAPTLVDKRGFLKSKILPIESRITELVGERFGDIFLTENLRTPVRGTLSAPAGGLQRIGTAEPVPPAQIGYYIGEMVLLANEIDPDTGGVGRLGRLVGGSYAASEGRADLVIDSSRGNFQALLSRLAVITGNTAGPSTS